MFFIGGGISVGINDACSKCYDKFKNDTRKRASAFSGCLFGVDFYLYLDFEI